MGVALQQLRTGLGGADVKPTVDLHRVCGDQPRSPAIGQPERQIRLPAGRGASEDQHPDPALDQGCSYPVKEPLELPPRDAKGHGATVGADLEVDLIQLAQEYFIWKGVSTSWARMEP